MRPTQLARLANVNPGQLSQIMHGKAFPSIDSLRRIASVLGVSPGMLLDGKIEESSGITSVVEHLAGALYSIQHLDENDQQKVLSIIHEVTQLFEKSPTKARPNVKSNLSLNNGMAGGD